MDDQVTCENCLGRYRSLTPRLLPLICPRCLNAGDFRVDSGSAQ